MLNFHDHAADIDETAFERARRTIAEYERTLLSAEDRAVVLAALDAPAEPTEALREAMVLHEAPVAYDG